MRYGKLKSGRKKGIKCPMYNEGEKAKASNYRGETLTCTAYKIRTKNLS